MASWRWLVLALAAKAAMAGCLSFARIPRGSACVPSSPELEWVNRPTALETVVFSSHPYDKTLADPALVTGVAVGGDLEFQLRAQGQFLVEVFLAVAADLRNGYLLEGPAGVLDARYARRSGPDRLRPKRGWRHITLLAILRGRSRFAVRSDASRYFLVAVRWTQVEVFEKQLAGLWLKRARMWAETPFAPDGEAARTRRRDYLEQLADRLALSRQRAVRREALLHQARAAYWLAAENHEPRDIELTHQLFQAALRAIPGDPILRQMISASCLGLNAPASRMPRGPYCDAVRPVPWSYRARPRRRGVPEWAAEQWELAARASAITRWWVEQRQRENGELGGGWGDDVEILRQWAPLALGLSSRVATTGIQRVADGVWSSGILLHGYDRQISDVEHSSEPSTDTVPLRVAILPEDPVGLARLKISASCAYNWIAPQPDGYWRFRGAWFNCREFDPAPERALDVHLNTRAMGPALWYAALTRDPRMIALLERWAESWLRAMRSTEHGKPRGIFPPVLRAADGSYLIGSERWDKPQAEWDYYQWSGEAQEALTSLLLALHDLTGQQRWLDAAGESFQIFENCQAGPDLCAQIRAAPAAFYEWRRRSGDSRYDRAFGYLPPSDTKALLARLAKESREAAARLAVNFAMYTSEVIYTDRVYYRWPPAYRWYLFGGEAPRGDRYPTFAVTWPPAKSLFARLVLDASSERLTLLLYNFEEAELAAPVYVWRLRPGLYRWAGGEARIERLPQRIELRLPPRREVTLEIVRVADRKLFTRCNAPPPYDARSYRARAPRESS